MRISTVRRAAIGAFVLFHLVSVACWAIPVNGALLTAYRNWVRPYFLFTGLFQSWDMFSPVPKSVNSYVEAIVLYADGNSRVWAFPRMERLSLPERYVKERYRKYVEYLKEDTSWPLWADAARFIARSNRAGPCPVKMVFLVRYWSNILPREDGSYAPSPWDEHVFCAYTVKAADLE